MSTKVLNVITGGLSREGITTTQLEFMKEMDKHDLQIDIAAVHNNVEDVISDFESSGCRVIRFPDRKKELFTYITEIYKQFKKENYDVVHVHGSSSLMAIELLLAKMAGIKTRIAHSRNTRADHKTVDKVLRPIFNISYTDAVACGNDAGEWLFGKKPFIVLHNGKNLDKFSYSEEQREKIRKKYDIKDKLAIGFVGNFNNQKNLPFLIEVIRCNNKFNSDCVYFLMGDGPERENILNKLHEYNLSDKVILTGRIPMIHDMLQGMDIMLLPSFFEGLPNVVLEWQAAGLPCLISDRITVECKVCDLVQFLPIKNQYAIWVQKINELASVNNRKVISEMACQSLKKHGFDLKENVEFIRNFYLDATRT